jgi:hypothetical protein
MVRTLATTVTKSDVTCCVLAMAYLFFVQDVVTSMVDVPGGPEDVDGL